MVIVVHYHETILRILAFLAGAPLKTLDLWKEPLIGSTNQAQSAHKKYLSIYNKLCLFNTLDTTVNFMLVFFSIAPSDVKKIKLSEPVRCCELFYLLS